MGVRSWTPEQQSAIDAHGGTLLVSAAAGSGKTAVLVQRVIEKLTTDDPAVHCDADRLLIVTFTRAAAAEMKERIAAALQALLAENPWDTRLRRQMLLLKKAQISTIHSFCSQLIRDHFYRLGISPDFRIADTAELKVLQEECVNEVLEKRYAQGDDGFFELVEQLIGDKNDSELSELLKALSDDVSAFPFPEDFLTWLENVYDADRPERTLWAQAVFEDVGRALDYAQSCNRLAREIAACDEKLSEKYLPAFEQDAVTLKAISSAIQSGDWEVLYRAVSAADVAPLGRVAKLPPEAALAKAARAEVKDVMEDIRASVTADAALFSREIAFTGRMVRQLTGLLRDYAITIASLKERRRVLDFGDLEHLAVRLLLERKPDVPADGMGRTDWRFAGGLYRKTDVALAVTQQYDEIMLDEYQDTNAVQSLIFAAIARNPEGSDPRELTDGTDLFMVGDMKQSIYRFRKAVPTLFLEKFKRYTPYKADHPQYPALIMLGANFRSRREVTDCVNYFFRGLMSEEMGGVAYDDSQALAARAIYPDAPNRTAELHFVIRPEGCEQSSAAYEADYLARLIGQMVGEGFAVTDKATGELRPARYSDFCILRRSMSGAGSDYVNALEAQGIPAWASTDGGLLDTDEANVLLSFLRVLNNPLLDIPLLCVMLSPIYGFTPDEMAVIRVGEKGAPLYGAVMTAAKAGDVKCAAFLESMEKFRLMAATMATHRLMEEIAYDTGYLAAIQSQPNGAMRLASLRLLWEFAASCEGSGTFGAGAFIATVDRMLAQGEDLPGASSVTENADVVRVMTIHKSKGLEFPICIVAGLGSAFQKDTDVSGVMLHSDLGLGMKMKEDGVYYDTQLRRAMIDRAALESLSEEMRVLYVALTRAREKLIMVATPRSFKKCLESGALAASREGDIHPYALVRSGSFAAWLMTAALRHPDGGELRDRLDMSIPIMEDGSRLRIVIQDVNSEDDELANEELEVLSEEKPEPSPAEETSVQDADRDLTAAIEERLNYRYPYESLEEIPGKVTASELTKREHSGTSIDLLRPSFLMTGGLTPTERGRALHKYMEFANFQAAAEAPEVELQRLTERGFLTQTEAAAVDLERVRTFFSQMSPMLTEARKILREREFSVLLDPAHLSYVTDIDVGDEPVVLEGECDCVLQYDDGTVIIDYKTDRIRDPDTLAAHYATQLRLYRYAMEQIFGVPVKGLYLYSFYTDRLIEIE